MHFPQLSNQFLQFLTDVVLILVLWRLCYRFGFRDVAELLVQRRFEVTTTRTWEYRFAPLVSAKHRAIQLLQRPILGRSRLGQAEIG